MSETTPNVFWDGVVQEFVRGGAASSPACADFFRPGVDRVALIRQALRMASGGNRLAAVHLIGKMPIDEQEQLFPDLIQAARAAHGPVGAVRETIMALPRGWVLARIDAEVEPILQSGEHDDYWMFLELYDKLDPARAGPRPAGGRASESRDTRTRC